MNTECEKLIKSNKKLIHIGTQRNPRTSFDTQDLMRNNHQNKNKKNLPY